MRQDRRFAIVLLFGVLSLCIFVFVAFDLIGTLGRNILQEDLASDYASGVLWALILGLSIFLWPVKYSEKIDLIVAWTARCLVTLVFMLFYEYYFDTDSFGYFYHSNQPVPDRWTGWVLGSGTENLWRLAWLHTQVLPYSFHLMKVSFSMVGFVATYVLYRAAVRFLQREDIRVFFALSLFPSIIFWSSIIGKDPVVLLGIAIYVYGVASWYQTHSLRYILVVLFGIWAAMLFRIWLGPILLAPLAVFALLKIRSSFSKFFFISVLVGAFFFAFGQFGQKFSIETNQDLVSTIDLRANNTGWSGATALQTGGSFTSVGQLLAFMPIGAFAALFRPLPGELFSVFGIFSGIENLVLLVLLFQAYKRTRVPELKDLRVMWALALILIWSSVYGFISYQNLGAASRFRLQILPVLLCTLLFLRRDRRLDASLVQK